MGFCSCTKETSAVTTAYQDEKPQQKKLVHPKDDEHWQSFAIQPFVENVIPVDDTSTTPTVDSETNDPYPWWNDFETSQSKIEYMPTDLWEAAKTGDVEAIHRFQLANPNQINAKSEENRTPLYFASNGGHYDACKVLLESGATDIDEDCYLAARDQPIRDLIRSHFKTEKDATPVMINQSEIHEKTKWK